MNAERPDEWQFSTLGRHYEAKSIRVWCCPRQDMPNGVRDGDVDWQRATSGGAVRYRLHTWDCFSVTQGGSLSSTALGVLQPEDSNAKLT